MSVTVRLYLLYTIMLFGMASVESHNYLLAAVFTAIGLICIHGKNKYLTANLAAGDSNKSAIKNTGAILAQVADERIRQETQWGSDHDDEHGPDHFDGLIKLWLYKVEQADDSNLKRRRFVEIAALAVSAIEVIDRDKQVTRSS